jgi:exo-beta-1,3-glucanase (GH17 family)
LGRSKFCAFGKVPFSAAARAETEGIEWFHFAAFDKTWKVDAERDVGALQPRPYGR